MTINPDGRRYNEGVTPTGSGYSAEPGPISVVPAVPVSIPNAAPQRIQLRRSKGWRMPPNTVKVDRTTKWGNPFRADEQMNAAGAVLSYRVGLRAAALRGLGWTAWAQRILDDLPNLRGKNLACWCPPGAPCHADVLLQLANAAIRIEAGTGGTVKHGPTRSARAGAEGIAQPSVTPRTDNAKYERFLRKAMDRSGLLDHLRDELRETKAELAAWKREHENLVYVREVDLIAVVRGCYDCVRSVRDGARPISPAPEEYERGWRDACDRILEARDSRERARGWRSAVAAWLRGEEAEGEATAVLFAIRDIADETFGEMARKVCAQLAYMVEYRADFASADTRRDGEDAVKLAAEFTSGAVPEGQTPKVQRHD